MFSFIVHISAVLSQFEMLKVIFFSSKKIKFLSPVSKKQKLLDGWLDFSGIFADCPVTRLSPQEEGGVKKRSSSLWRDFLPSPGEVLTIQTNTLISGSRGGCIE